MQMGKTSVGVRMKCAPTSSETAVTIERAKASDGNCKEIADLADVLIKHLAKVYQLHCADTRAGAALQRIANNGIERLVVEADFCPILPAYRAALLTSSISKQDRCSLAARRYGDNVESVKFTALVDWKTWIAAKELNGLGHGICVANYQVPALFAAYLCHKTRQCPGIIDV